MVVHVPGRSLLAEPAEVPDGGAVADVPYHGQVMGDEQQRDFRPASALRAAC